MKEKLNLFQAKIERRDARFTELRETIAPSLPQDSPLDQVAEVILDEVSKIKSQFDTNRDNVLKKEGALEMQSEELAKAQETIKGLESNLKENEAGWTRKERELQIVIDAQKE